jgi:hypothetical protein
MGEFVLMVGLTVGQPAPAEVAEVVNGHRATLSRYRTVQGTFRYEDANPRLNAEVEYFRDAERARLRPKSPGPDGVDLLMVAGQLRQLTRFRQDRHGGRTGSLRAAGNVWPADFTGYSNLNPWPRLLLSFLSEGAREADLATIAADPAARFTADRTTLDGVAVIRTRYECGLPNGARLRLENWHDPARSYLVVRRDRWWTLPSGSAGHSVATLTDFIVTPDGVHFPTRVRFEVVETSEPTKWTASMTGVVLNRDLPTGILDLPLPPGTPVQDAVRGTEYVAGPDWKPAGPERPWSQKLLAAPAPAQTGGFTGPSQTEPRSWTRALLVASVVALVAAGGAVAVVRHRAARAG